MGQQENPSLDILICWCVVRAVGKETIIRYTVMFNVVAKEEFFWGKPNKDG